MKIIHSKSAHGLRASVILALLFVVFLQSPGALFSQQRLANEQPAYVLLDSVTVDIWPEYDRPSVLIIYHVKLSGQVSLPAQVSFRIPASAGKPHAVAWQATDNALYDLNYEIQPVGEWSEISFSTPAPDFQIEYYDANMKKTGNRRDFTFRWPGMYTVENLSLQIKMPMNATNVKFIPDVGSGRIGDDGLTYYSLLVGKVDAGTTFDLAMSYDKPDDTLTNPEQFQEAQPNQPLDSGTTGRVALDQLLPWSVGGLGLLLIAAGLFWYWRTGRVSATRAAQGRPRHARSQPVKPVPAIENSGEPTFCHQCGKKAAPGDVFCRTCGTRLR